MKPLQVAIAITLLLSAKALALPITVKSDWEVWGLPDSPLGVPGVIEFTYNDATPDERPDDVNFGLYLRPLIALSLVFGDQQLRLDNSQSSEITIYKDDSCWACTDFSLSATVRDKDHHSYHLALSSDWGAPTPTDSINALVGKMAHENASFLFGYSEPVPIQLLQRTPFTKVSVPEPSSIALFSLGLIGLLARKITPQKAKN